jgi:predicted small metal-binding protein
LPEGDYWYFCDGRNSELSEHIDMETLTVFFGLNRLDDGRRAMSVSISCRELGMDCHFVTQVDYDFLTLREAEEVVIDSLMRHVHTEHTDDWFEIDKIYQAACKAIREKAA